MLILFIKRKTAKRMRMSNIKNVHLRICNMKTH